MNRKRSQGEFYTPGNFARFSHQVIADVFGDDWYEKYVVWDPAWGLGNLTNDLKFNELYASTINQDDIDKSLSNPESDKFRFDFLNDPLISLVGMEIPQGLYDALANDKPIIFFMNPPYVSATDMINERISDKDVIVETEVQKYMGKLKQARSNLFSQFLYRVLMLKKQFKLTDCNICVFSSIIFMSGTGYDRFRREFLKEFSYQRGYLFNAKYFDECSDRWGISFSVWKSGESLDKNEFPHYLLDVINDEVKIVGDKLIYNIDGETSFRESCKLPNKGKETFPTVTLKSAVNVGDKVGGRLTMDAIGFYVNVGNNVYQSLRSCYLLSSCPNSMISGFSVIPDNFEIVCANFSARKCVCNDWINDKDEFITPDIKSEIWGVFVADSVVYSLFNAASQQSSLVDAEWMGDFYRIRNEFFFVSVEEMRVLSEKFGNDECFGSCEGDVDRFVYKYLGNECFKNNVSDIARDVLNKGIELVRKSFVYRKEFSFKRPELQVNNWDAGYMQLRPMFEEYLNDDLKDFRKTYKKLTNKLNADVYRLGILK